MDLHDEYLKYFCQDDSTESDLDVNDGEDDEEDVDDEDEGDEPSDPSEPTDDK